MNDFSSAGETIPEREACVMDMTNTDYGKYVNAKRLFSARDKIRHGMSLTDACYSSGFQHYSTFTRSYYRMFQTTPGSLKRES